MLYGMARENSLPAFLGRIHRKTKTPWLAIIAIGLLSIVFVFVGDISFIANLTSLGALVSFVVINLSVIWLRYTKPDLERPFKIPLNVGKYPLLSFFGIFSCLFLIYQFDWQMIAASIAVIAVGAVFYWLRRNKIIE
jgi:APA family basic amino acid/polyamine antiporter